MGRVAPPSVLPGTTNGWGRRSDPERNLFIEYLLPLRTISAEALEVSRRHYRNPGSSLEPMLAWTPDLPITGEPSDAVQRCISSHTSNGRHVMKRIAFCEMLQ